jgi:hypothetical protein
MDQRPAIGLSLLPVAVVVFFAIPKYGMWALLLGIALIIAGIILMVGDDSQGHFKREERRQSSDAGAIAYLPGDSNARSATANSKGAHDHADPNGSAGDGGD